MPQSLKPNVVSGFCATCLVCRSAAWDSYLGPFPVITISFEISEVGVATIFVAETFMPFLRSLTVAGLPSEVNVNESGTVYPVADRCRL